MSSPERNRVTPMGDIVAIPLRGAFTGNRGILHEGHEIVRFHASDLWITCALKFKDWWGVQWIPHHFTWLYFHDEAVSFAAGHRPVRAVPARGLRRLPRGLGDARARRRAAVGEGDQPPLHGERIVRGTHRRRLHDARWRDLPDGAFVVVDDGTPRGRRRQALIEWSPAPATAPSTRARCAARRRVITPPSTIAALQGGISPQIACT